MSTTTISEVKNAALAPREASMPIVRAGFFDLQGFELMQRVAKMFSSSTLVPQQYQNNVANCMIALNLARRLGADELMVMQNLYIVHGNPGWSSKFLIASVNTCGRYESLRYEWRGKQGDADWGCRAWTIEKSTGERLNGVWIDWKMVQAEGWNKKSGSKWITMPEQMFVYRSAAFWQRAYAPEISMGLSSAEELQDVVNVRPDGSVEITSEAFSLSELRKPVPRAEVVGAEVPDATTEPAPAAAAGQAGQFGSVEPATHGEDGAASGGGAATFDDVQRELEGARTIEDLDFARSLIRQIDNEQDKAELNQIAARRMRDIAPPEPGGQGASAGQTAAAATRRPRAPVSAD
ncbi:hypothetical protein ACKZDW_02235 (plasmid) [Ralstonia syzygii subsp. celebesensis]|uniref:hypothetical protein n=1 Tax=Ralstonia syzygii TaxID=28097 RepID=UPI00387E0B4C